jgi:hypothetical protein
MSQQRQPGKGGTDQQAKPAPKPAPRTSTGGIPALGGEFEAAKPRPTGAHALPAAARAPGAKGAPEAPVTDGPSDMATDTSILTKLQKSQLGSGFQDSAAERRRSTLLAATTPSSSGTRSDLPVVAQDLTFDGKEAPKELQNRDLWKAVQAPLQSVPGRRSKKVYENVLRQFALLSNPRYGDDAPGKTRGHIFVWDVSRAMNCEIPHFVGAKELTLAQTCDWLRHEGPMRGWKRVSDYEIYERANAGFLVVALPREARTKQIAIVAPQEQPDDNSPRLDGICLQRGHGRHPREMFGAKPVDCFWHD